MLPNRSNLPISCLLNFAVIRIYECFTRRLLINFRARWIGSVITLTKGRKKKNNHARHTCARKSGEDRLTRDNYRRGNAIHRNKSIDHRAGNFSWCETFFVKKHRLSNCKIAGCPAGSGKTARSLRPRPRLQPPPRTVL